MKNDSSPTLLPRRQFLVLGSAAVAAAAATSVSADIVRSVLVTEEPAPSLSVGFAKATLDDFAKPSFAPRLVGASKLRSGEPSLAGGVHLRIHGMVRPATAASQNVNASVDAMYRVAGREETVPYMAWTHSRIGATDTASTSKPVLVPVGAKQPLTLAISSSAVATAASRARLQGTVNLALGQGRRENKLRSGLYFVAICPAGMPAPHWSSIHAVPSENGKLPVLMEATVLGLKPVPFDYIVFTAARA